MGYRLDKPQLTCYHATMHDAMTTVITRRGQTSVPARLRKAAHLKTGTRLRWHQTTATEFRVVLETGTGAPGPLAALGYAVRFHGAKVPTTAEALTEIREGEAE